MKKSIFILLLILSANLAATIAFAQQKQKTHNYSNIDPSKWIIPKTDTLAYAQTTYDDRPALLLKRNFLDNKKGACASIAYPKDLNFKDGVIELDIASPTGGGGYVGIAFRIMDDHHYEALYFRPGYSGSINAVQYMPEKKAEFDWWDYEADKYQAKAALPLTTWFHVKAVVKGRTLTVFVSDQSEPVMVYNDLDRSLKNGAVGFWMGNSPSGAYKNLVVTTDK